MKIRAIFVIFSFIISASGADLQKLPNTAPASPVSQETKFIHPGLYHSAADLAFMRQKIEARAEPWFGAWTQLKSGTRLNWTPHPVADWHANKNSYMQGDAVVAYQHALVWALSGEAAHAAKAIEILNAWSAALETIHGTISQEMLVCGWNGSPLANAAELLRYYTPREGKPSGWSPSEIERFRKLLELMRDVMKNFKPDFNGNWDAAMMNSLLCMAVFDNDPALFKTVTNHFHGNYSVANPRKANNGHLTSYILPSGQCQESGRDQGHVQMGLGNYVALCEVAWKQGVDLYGACDNRLAKGLEYTAKYMLGHDDLPFEKTPPSTWIKISETGRGRFIPIWEAAYQHYVFRKGLALPFTTQVVLSSNTLQNGRREPGPYRPEGATPNAGICWGTLTMFRGTEERAHE